MCALAIAHIPSRKGEGGSLRDVLRAGSQSEETAAMNALLAGSGFPMGARARRLAMAGALAGFVLSLSSAQAGPPYISDDPEPTDYKHWEIYLFTGGSTARDDTAGSFGLDFNYGATPDLQLTAVFPVAYDVPQNGPSALGLGNVELAAKYRVLHQAEAGVDVAVFPRVFLPSGSALVGEQHASLLLPVWLQKDWDKWSVFGGGGCELNRGGTSQDFCLAGVALTRQVFSDLQLGVELVHQTADTKGGRTSTLVGAGLRYDFSDRFHVLAYAAPGLQNANETARLSWYSSLLLTF
jgi:hypothetical protein